MTLLEGKEEVCEDDDAGLSAAAAGVGLEVEGCADAKEYCEHEKYGAAVQKYCCETCEAACEDDDAGLSAAAAGAGLEVEGCAHAKEYCEHEKYGAAVQKYCCETCDATCEDDDAGLSAAAEAVDLVIEGCADAKEYCEHEKYGAAVQKYCCETCSESPAPSPGGDVCRINGKDGTCADQVKLAMEGVHGGSESMPPAEISCPQAVLMVKHDCEACAELDLEKEACADE